MKRSVTAKWTHVPPDGCHAEEHSCRPPSRYDVAWGTRAVRKLKKEVNGLGFSSCCVYCSKPTRSPACFSSTAVSLQGSPGSQQANTRPSRHNIPPAHSQSPIHLDAAFWSAQTAPRSLPGRAACNSTRGICSKARFRVGKVSKEIKMHFCPSSISHSSGDTKQTADME